MEREVEALLEGVRRERTEFSSGESRWREECQLRARRSLETGDLNRESGVLLRSQTFILKETALARTSEGPPSSRKGLGILRDATRADQKEPRKR